MESLRQTQTIFGEDGGKRKRKSGSEAEKYLREKPEKEMRLREEELALKI